jgi:hypothetical protein
VNKGTIALVGCVMGAGALWYTQQGAVASRPVAPAEDTATTATELAHSQTTRTPSPTVKAGSTATPTQQKLTLAQVQGLPRPLATPTQPRFGGGSQPAPGSAPTEPPTASETPSGQPSPTPSPSDTALPPAETPGTPTPTSTPQPPVATPTSPVNPWPIATPPTLPPYPDAGVSGKPPSE